MHKMLEIRQKQQKHELYKYKKDFDKLKKIIKDYTKNETISPSARDKFNSYKERDDKGNIIDKKLIFNIFELFYCDAKEHYLTMDELHKKILDKDEEEVIKNTVNYIIDDKMNEIKHQLYNIMNMENEDINVNMIEEEVDNIINELENNIEEMKCDNIINELENNTEEMKSDNIINELENNTEEMKSDNLC